MNRKQKRWLLRILIAGVLFAGLFICEHTGLTDALPWFVLPLSYLLPYLIIGYDVLLKAAKNILRGQVFDENFLMMIATFGAFGVHEYAEAVAVMLFYQVGEWFQHVAVDRSRQSIREMMEIVPEYANIEQDGELSQVDPDDVPVGSIITVLPGERIPLDGIVESGSSYIDTAALTGESVPRHAVPGDTVISGCVNGSGVLTVKTTKEFDDSTVTKILELVENASSQKARTENFITRFAHYYTPIVTIAAVLLALLPPFITGESFGMWIERACIFLVISCPCALVISVPLGFFGGIGAASKIGVLIKGSDYLEQAASLSTVVFDKTGTLTCGDFRVTSVHPVQPGDDILSLAARLEAYSNHPIAVSIREAAADASATSARVTDASTDAGTDSPAGTPVYDRQVTHDTPAGFTEIAGRGIRASLDGYVFLAGNTKLMRDCAVDFTPCDEAGTVVYLAKSDASPEKDEQPLPFTYLGYIVIRDTIKEHVREDLTDLYNAGVKKTVMLTGDHLTAANRVAEALSIDEVRAELLPGDKVQALESLLDPTGQARLAFVGDGINDAPVLMRADVGFAMGSMGSDAAIEAADIVIMDDDLGKIAKTIRLARKTVRIVKENIVFALGVKFAILVLGTVGIANMWLAVFADVGVAVLAILNSMRMLRRRS